MNAADILFVTNPYDTIGQIAVPLLYDGDTYELNLIVKNPLNE
jgi:hypothetical protein